MNALMSFLLHRSRCHQRIRSRISFRNRSTRRPSSCYRTYVRPFHLFYSVCLCSPGVIRPQTGESIMTWTLKNSSNGPEEIAWSASPTSGTIEAFGETVVEVVASTRRLNARQKSYVASFDIHSDDICVCRDQSVEMAIELVVTAETSAANSYVQVLDAANVEASGELVFRIIPVRPFCTNYCFAVDRALQASRHVSAHRCAG